MTKKISILSLIAVFSCALLIAGCGGGGASSAASGSTHTVKARINFNYSPSLARTAATTGAAATDYSGFDETETLFQGCGNFKTFIASNSANSSVVPVYIYVNKNGISGPYIMPVAPANVSGRYMLKTTAASSYSSEDDYMTVASTCVVATCTNNVCTADFQVDNVPVGDNLVIGAAAGYPTEGTASYYQTGSESYTTYPVFNYDEGESLLVTNLVDIDEGVYTEDVVLNPATTLKTFAAMYYSSYNNVRLADLPEALFTAIDNYVATTYPGGIFYGGTGTGHFADQYEIAEMMEAVYAGINLPKLLSFSPAANATGISYNSPKFKAVFDRSLDSSVVPADYEIVITNPNTGSSVTITPANIAQYGTYSYATTNLANDTLAFILKPNSSLPAGARLAPATTYGVYMEMPTNIVDTLGRPWPGSADPNSPFEYPGSMNYYTTSESAGPALTSVVISTTDGDVEFTPPYLTLIESRMELVEDTPYIIFNFDKPLDTSIQPTGFTADITKLSTGTVKSITAENFDDFADGSYINDGYSVKIAVKSSAQLAPGLYTAENINHPTNLVGMDGLEVTADLGLLEEASKLTFSVGTTVAEKVASK